MIALIFSLLFADITRTVKPLSGSPYHCEETYIDKRSPSIVTYINRYGIEGDCSYVDSALLDKVCQNDKCFTIEKMMPKEFYDWQVKFDKLRREYVKENDKIKN